MSSTDVMPLRYSDCFHNHDVILYTVLVLVEDHVSVGFLLVSYSNASEGVLVDLALAERILDYLHVFVDLRFQSSHVYVIHVFSGAEVFADLQFRVV